ncbi:uncharacterized protein B0H64DRAFT_394790 [Chaetomium fimeti]|uniref:F-box domain-containing protein n=1 Tax=Chaetomium fimeti TaxID=1854472 RepID=A0AAE0HGM5_9PEZI|nr:hypothetical protein B0H64DRAFT_394790 [Chaetomium fimeti]
MSSTSHLLHLPAELLVMISSLLPNRDIKSLRLTCRFLVSAINLRLTRVFLSASRRNVDVFRAIAQHDTFRKQIVEIIWDDARLVAREAEREADYHPYERWTIDEIVELHGDQSRGDCPRWFWEAYEANLTTLESRRGYDVDRPDHVARDQVAAKRPSLEESWAHYQVLLRQQDEVIHSGADAEAFRYGLERFTSLKRVTVTPFAHGFWLTPLYETPMIRAFPRGFNYPIPRTWPVNDKAERPVAHRWNEMSEDEKDRWRGFRIVTRELAKAERCGVSELFIDVNHLLSGINCTIFSEPSAEYDNLLNLLRRQGFRRLDLALTVGDQGYEEEWSAFRSGYLRRALSETSDLEHISLRTDEDEQDPDWSQDPVRHFVPLNTILPVDNWPFLRHFGLSQFLVRQGDLISLLARLPTTLRSVELSHLVFLQGNYRDFLGEMRDSLNWRTRARSKRPKIRLAIPIRQSSELSIWVDKEVDEFLYADGMNPFQTTDGHTVPYGVGVVRDVFNPNHERPNLSLPGLADAGYIKHVYFNGQRIV